MSTFKQLQMASTAKVFKSNIPGGEYTTGNTLIAFRQTEKTNKPPAVTD